jgi:TRAP-type C4-dicarboxylate transport system permease large subunit
MSDFDLDRLGDVWRQQLGPAEMERLQRTAAAVSRRARFSQIVDVLAGLAVSAVVILLVFANPTTETVLMGSAAILVLFGGNVRQRKLRQVELKSLTGSTEDMLNQSIARVEATLKRTRYSLFAIGPALLVGWVFMNAVTGRPVRGLLPSVFDAPWFRFLWNGGWAFGLAIIVAAMVLSIRRSRRELQRLVSMRDAYREERESSTS